MCSAPLTNNLLAMFDEKLFDHGSKLLDGFNRLDRKKDGGKNVTVWKLNESLTEGLSCQTESHPVNPRRLGKPQMPPRESVAYQLSALCQVRMNGSLQCQTCTQTCLPTKTTHVV